MFSTFFRFELGFWLRGRMVYLFLMIVIALTVGAMSSDSIVIGNAVGNTMRNAPYAIQNFYVMYSLIICLVVTTFVDGALNREFSYETNELVFSKPLGKWQYLLGRFLGALIIALIPFVGISIAALVAPWMPWNNADRFGPTYWGAHFWGILLFAVPNVILVGAVVFAVATTTRKPMYSFIGIIALVTIYGLAGKLSQSLEHRFLGAMLDPFCLNSFSVETNTWSKADRNTMFVTLNGLILWNRLIWLAIAGLIVGIAGRRFQFAQRLRRGKSIEHEVSEVAIPLSKRLTTVHHHYGNVALLKQVVSQTSIDFWGIIKSPVFIVMFLASLINSTGALSLSSSEGFGNTAIPTTSFLTGILQSTQEVLILAVVTYYSGVLVWREKESKLDQVIDVLPHPTWVSYLGKLAAIIFVVVVIKLTSIATGLIVQINAGYMDIDLGAYARELLAIGMVYPCCIIIMAFGSHVVSPNKFIGYIVFITFLVINQYAWSALKVKSLMFKFGYLPTYVYSEMFGVAPFSKTLFWFGAYWFVSCLAISVTLILLWPRGVESNVRHRVKNASLRFKAGAWKMTLVATALWAAVALWVFYNTQVLNPYDSVATAIQKKVDYETKFKGYEDVAQPEITSVKYEIDIFPYQSRLHIKAQQTIKNKTAEPIEELHFTFIRELEYLIEVDGAEAEKVFDDLGYRVYRFDPPLAPGQETEVRFESTFQRQGFENQVQLQQLVQNGTFFNNQMFPEIGYQRTRELTDKRERERWGLVKREALPALDPENRTARQENYIGCDWVDVETIISTASDQVAVAPGSLVKKWREGDRNFYHYKLDHRSMNFYSFISAKYKVATREWKGVGIEVYYHPEHEQNVDRMLRAIRSSLEYYSESFGPYQHKQARIIEFPRVAYFAQAFPGTMPYSEGMGFITDLRDDQSIDIVYHTVAHEIAHQWWAHQVVGAWMEGATMLSETLAQYCALMVLEKEYGQDRVRDYLAYESSKYLRSRGGVFYKEKPLVSVTTRQGYIHYRKGSLAMYCLKEMIGEDQVNAALRTLIDRFAFQGPPYATSMDLVEAFREQTPEELQYLITDLFETITFHSNKATHATYRPIEDGKYEVSVDVTCKKFRTDGDGVDSPIKIDDWIEVGAVLASEKGSRGTRIYRERVHVQSEKSTFRFIVDEKPLQAGIDPLHLLIDRNTNDNLVTPSLEK